MKVFAIITAALMASAGGAYYLNSTNAEPAQSNASCPVAKTGGCCLDKQEPPSCCATPCPACAADCSECCDDCEQCCVVGAAAPVAAKTSAKADCCAAGVKATVAKTSAKADCCAAGDVCCTDVAACCLAGAENAVLKP